MVQPLEGTIRMYPWGSRTQLATMAGRPSPAPHPEAEMWFGAHPGGPAQVDGEPLDVLIASDSIAALGRPISQRYHGKLPFLLKLLAAESPLSLQAHPTKEQARQGFAREDTLGIERTALDRNYKDDNHKPELIVALTEFDAMCGFRPVDQTLELFDSLAVPELDRYRMMLTGVVPSEGLRGLLTTWITLPSEPRRNLISAVLAGVERYRESGEKTFELVAQNITLLADRYPGDPGVLCALLLNHVRLQPGEGIYLDAGQLHAYVHGFGVEIMANSDNVLRGGLTSKHIDVPELVRILNFEPLANPVIDAKSINIGGGQAEGAEGVYYPTPAPEFVLQRWELAIGSEISLAENEGLTAAEGPMIILCTRGTVRVDGALDDGFGPLTLTPSQAAWIPAEQRNVSVAAAAESTKSEESAEVFIAAVPR